MTVLIADDSELSRRVLSILLTRHGYRVLEAGDGDEGLQIMRSEHPDLAVVDLLMPVMDGFEFVRAVRADPAIAQTPVIFLTANFPAQEVIPLAEALGVRHTVMKSRSTAELLKAVREAASTLTPPEVSLADFEFRQEHFRLISSKLAEEFGSLATAFGDLLASAAPPRLKPEGQPDTATEIPEPDVETPGREDSPPKPDPVVDP